MYTHNRLKGEVEETEEPRRTKQLIKEEEETHMSEVEGEKWWIKVEGGVGGGSLHEPGTQHEVLQDIGQDKTRTEGEPRRSPDESRS